MTNKQVTQRAREIKSRLRNSLPLEQLDLLGNEDTDYAFLCDLYHMDRSLERRHIRQFVVRTRECGGFGKPTFVAVLDDWTEDFFSVSERLATRQK